MAEKLKDTGNEAFKRGEYQEALRLYRRALEAVRPDESAQLVPAIHNNCAITHLKLAQWKDAVASASIALSSEPRNEKALHRRAQAYVALNNISAALVDARAAAQMKDSMPEVLALYRALAQQDRRIVRGFNPRKSLPRTRPSTLSRVYEYRPLGYDPICNIFAGDAENAIPPIALHEQEEMFGYFGGAADGRHFFTTISLLGSELTKAKANGRISTTRVRLYINDINPAAIVRLIVLLVALDRLAQCADLDNAAKDPRTADPETASAAFLLTNLFIGGGIYEEQHRAATGILQAFVADPRKSLPKWLTLGPNGLKDITDAASAMLKSTRAWGSEIPRLRSYFEQANNAHAKAEKAAGPQAQENVVASFFADSLQLNDSDINERFAHVEAKNAEERRAKLTQFRKIALSLPRQALSVAEALPGLLTDLHSWVQNYRLSPPQQLSALEKQRLYLNPTLLDERWLSRGGNIEGFPRPDVLLSLTEDVREDSKTRRPLMQYDLCADVVALAFCRAALGLRRFLRGDRAPELQVILRVGDLAADLDELHREGVLCDRILANNVGDYAGLMPILTSSSRILRPSKGKASLRTNILLAPSAWTSTEHYIYEYCRLRAAEVRTLLHLQPKVSDVWKDMVFATVEARECGAAAPEQVYEWLAGLFLAIVRPAQRQRQAVRVLSPSSMAVWFVAAEQARARHGDAAVVKVLRDLLSNQLTTRHRYPASVPEKAPTKKKPAPEMQNVRPYLSELRALSVLWMLPTLANNVISDLDLAALRIARNSLALKVECHLPLPPEWRDDFACGEPNNFSLGLVIFTGPTAAALERTFPHSLLNGEEGVEAFSVLHWNSPKHVAKIWLTVEDFVRLTRAEGQGRVRLFHSDSYTFVGPQWLDVHALVAHDRKAGDLPPSQADAPHDKARPAAAPAAAAAPALPPVVPAAAPAAAVTALPVVEKKAAKPRSDSPPALWEPPASVAAAAAAAARPTSPVLPAVSPAPLYANAAVAGAPPASFAASAASANFAAVSVTSGAMQPATAVAIAPITADELFEPFMSHAALAPKPAQEKPGSAERVAELEAQVRQLSMQLDLAKADAAAANARASRHEAEIARMKEERRNEEEAWQGDKRGGGGGGGGGGKGRGRGRK